MKISAAACSETGRVRKNNEDNLYFGGEFLDEQSREHAFSSQLECECEQMRFAVCDGMGGESRGEDASLAGVKAFKSWCAERTQINDSNWDEQLKAYFEKANSCVKKLTEGTDEVSGCTGVVLVLTDGAAYFGNVGDSRLYHLRNGKAVRLSHDHTVAQMYIDLGELTEEEANSSSYKHQLMRFLGAPEGVNALPYTRRLRNIKNGDRFLLCSDGLTDMLSDDEIAKLGCADSCREAVKRLFDRAMKNGGRDNCTIILAQADEMAAVKKDLPAGRFLKTALAVSAALLAVAALLMLLVKTGVIG